MSNCREFDTVMPNKRINVTIDEEQKKKIKIDDGNDSPSPSSYLPEDLVIENVLTRLPAKDLARFTSVSKLWYNSILNDKRFAVSHFVHHRNRSNLTFNLFNVSDGNNGRIPNYFFHLHKDSHNEHDNLFYNFELLWRVGSVRSIISVGNCNGLACVKSASKSNSESIIVINPFNREALTLTYLTPEVEGGGGLLEYFCHGFGFDSLSQEYKIVVIYTTNITGGDQGFICMVITLGDTVWRKIVISPSEISPPPGRSSFPSRMWTRSDLWDDTHRSATICGGDLLWRITIVSPDNDYYDYDDNDSHEIEVLLSFDIHNEKIQFIRLPNECNSLIKTMNEEVDYFELRHHLLEFKGYPCVAYSEKISIKERVGTHPYGLRLIHYQFKVHMYILKDKVKQIWIEEETFDVRFVEDNLKPDSVSRVPFDQYFNKNEHSSNHRSHPTRMCTFSDQVMLYWFDGGCLIFYNLRKKHHNVVKGTRSCNKRIQNIFEAKIEGLPDPHSHDVPECPCIDYQLHAQVENIISLKTFIPKGGEVCEFDSYKEFQQFVRDKRPLGWMDTGRKSPKWYAFY